MSTTQSSSHAQGQSQPQTQGKNAYATLLTRPSYLAGAVLLAYTLTQHSPSTPLIILYTPETLPEPCIQALETESKHSNIILRAVEHLRLPSPDPDSDAEAGGAHGMVAERFIDTWTKLRVFELADLGLAKLCFLDADMMIFRDPSPAIFERDIPPLHLGASHVCVCNLDRDAWAPKSWNPSNCAFSAATGPDDIPPAVASHETKGIMNTGTFVFAPTQEMADLVLSAFRDTPRAHLARLKFPDQDFLNEVFSGKWVSLHWSVNALKTWRYWHANFWRDERVAVLHYIVDKPWAARVGSDGVAGYKGEDGETHSWWWERFAGWKEEREQGGEEERGEVAVVGRYVAGEGREENEELSAVGGGAQRFAKKWEGEGEEAQEKEDSAKGEEGDGQEKEHPAPGGPVLRKPMLGERGHGPVVRNFSSGGSRGGRGLSKAE